VTGGPEGGPAPGRPDSASADRAELLALLREKIAGQIRSAEAGDLDAVNAAADEIRDLLNALDPSPTGPAAEAERPAWAELADLQRRLALTLAQQREELADRLSHSRRGRSALRAYER
jgi:hypothetical protein